MRVALTEGLCDHGVCGELIFTAGVHVGSSMYKCVFVEVFP